MPAAAAPETAPPYAGGHGESYTLLDKAPPPSAATAAEQQLQHSSADDDQQLFTQRGVPFLALNADLVSVDEARSAFILRGRCSFLWQIAGLPLGSPSPPSLAGGTEHGSAGQPHRMATELAELLAAVVAGGSEADPYATDPHYPKTHIGNMKIPDEGFFYDYRQRDKDGRDSIHLVKFLMGSGQMVMAQHWDAMGAAAGQLMSEACELFLARFVSEPMRQLLQPLLQSVARMFLKWGSGHWQNYKKGPENAKKPRIQPGSPGNFWYWQAFENHRLGKPNGQDTRCEVLLFEALRTAVVPRQWQLLYHPADGLVTLDLGRPAKLDFEFSETLELHSFPLDRQLLNVRFSALVPQPVGSPPTDVAAAHPRYASSFFTYKISDHLLCNEEWSFLEPVSIERLSTRQPSVIDVAQTAVSREAVSKNLASTLRRSAGVVHFAIRLERRLDRTLHTVILPEFIIVCACSLCLAFEQHEMEQRLNIVMMLLLTSVALSQVSVSTHEKVPYSTYLEIYMGSGIMLLALCAAETVVVSRVVQEPDVQNAVEKGFFGIIGGAWVMLHALVFIFPNSRVLRQRWETLARMETDKVCKFERREASPSNRIRV